MITYTFKDDETGQELQGECHEMLFIAGEDKKDEFEARVLYDGNNQYPEELAEAVINSLLEDRNVSIRDILLRVWVKMAKRDYKRELVQYAYEDAKRKMKKFTEKIEANEKDFEEFMSDNGFGGQDEAR